MVDYDVKITEFKALRTKLNKWIEALEDAKKGIIRGVTLTSSQITELRTKVDTEFSEEKELV